MPLHAAGPSTAPHRAPCARGRCKNCRDKPRFGGPGIKKKACLARICVRALSGDDSDDDESEQTHNTEDDPPLPSPQPDGPSTLRPKELHARAPSQLGSLQMSAQQRRADATDLLALNASPPSSAVPSSAGGSIDASPAMRPSSPVGPGAATLRPNAHLPCPP